MKGDICKHFCQIDQAFFFYQRAIESTPSSSQSPGMSQALSNMGDLYKFQGKMQLAIQHYEKALLSEVRKQAEAKTIRIEGAGSELHLSQVRFLERHSIADIYAQTFVKLFNAKMACCDWRDYDLLQAHLREIVLNQYNSGLLPCIDPFSLFMLDFAMSDKLIISQKWAEAEKQKAVAEIEAKNIPMFEPFQHKLAALPESNAQSDSIAEDKQFFKIRVGYVSYDFADHPLAHLLNSLFALHCRSTF